jgi:hypothetical protein
MSRKTQLNLHNITSNSAPHIWKRKLDPKTKIQTEIRSSTNEISVGYTGLCCKKNTQIKKP